MSIRFKTNPEQDPRSKVIKDPEKMEDWELVAILLGKGSNKENVEQLAKHVLYQFTSLSGLLNAPSTSLLNISGLGKAKIANLFAARELVNRIKLDSIYNQKNPSTDNFYNLLELLTLRTKNQVRECFFLITLNYDKTPIRIEQVAKGSLSEVGVHLRDLVKLILDDGAKQAIITHNHPNQVCKPSEEDISLYLSLRSLLSSLEVDLLDQWIIGNDGIYSCKKRQKIYTPNPPQSN